MFEVFDSTKQLKPIKIWLDDLSQVDKVCQNQALNLSNHPYLVNWVALMPDTHQGYGMPIGGVAAFRDIVIPNAVGVDIGCGMIFVETNLKKEKLKERHYRKLIHDIMAAIPLGFKHHDIKQEAVRIDERVTLEEELLKKNYTLYKEIENAYYQIGTLGSGNHFIEIQEDEAGMLCLMIHSGSRNFGYKVANYFNEKAKYYTKKHGDSKWVKAQLPYLMAESEAGQDYIRWMNLALLFARENRIRMMEVVQDIIESTFSSAIFNNRIIAHHNYAAFEHHFGEDVWVHRKGAIRVYKDEMGIIPGAMGSYSYIVKGLGNHESFCSCSHGAGRHLSRRQAIKKFKKEVVLKSLRDEGIYIGSPSKSDLGDEYREAYKEIEYVISKQKDLIVPVKKLKTVMVIKG